MSNEYEVLSNAPVREGLIDLRVNFGSTPTQDNFRSIAEELKDAYPECSTLQGIGAHFEFNDSGVTQSALTTYRGVLLTSRDRTFVFQAQVDGFTVSRLRPYTEWKDLLDETRKLWTVFSAHTQPVAVTRIAVRYVNSFELPGPISNLREYFEAPPELPSKLDFGVSSFLSRLQIPDPETASTVLLTQTMEGSTSELYSFVFDIDVFRVQEFETSQQRWWDELQKLRNLKNRVFFSSLTPKTIGRFR